MTTAVVTPTGSGLRARIAAVPVTAWLAGLVVASFALRVAATIGHVTPRLFPDEYIYAALGRSLGEGSMTVRGEPAAFPAFLEPLLAAPLWRLAGDDVELGYRLVQGMHALAVSLVAVPVYLIGRRIGLERFQALAAAALALLLPMGLYASYITADALGLLMAASAVAVGVAVLERPTSRGQALFLAWAGLAAVTRIQYAVLPLVFLAGALVVERGALRRTIGTYRLTLAVLAGGAVLVAVAGAERVLGYYRSVADLSLDPAGIARWAATDAFLLAYAAGWVLVPGALVGLALALRRPRGRAEHGFAALSLGLTLALLAEAGVYAANGSDRFQERYLAALLPLVPLLFFAGAGRLTPARGARIATAVVAGGLVAVSAAVPLSGFTVLTGKQDSPLLQAVARLEVWAGVGRAGLAVALLAMLAGVLAAVAAWRRWTWLPVAVCAGLLGATTLGAVSYDLDASSRAHRTFVGDDTSPTWVDAHGLGSVAVLQTPFSSRTQVSDQLFWNASLDRILRMPDASEVDAYGSDPVRIARDGTILAAGEPVTTPLLVEEYASWAALDGAALVERKISSALWRPDGTVRLSVLLAGRYLDGWLGARSRLRVWPGEDGRRTGVVRMRLSLPEGAPTTTLDVRGAGIDRAVAVSPGRPAELAIPFDTSSPLTVVLRPRRPLLVDGGRLVSVLASAPRVEERPNEP
jgi:hypothetical protein